MRRSMSSVLSLVLASSFLLQSVAQANGAFPAWAYDAGPNPKDAVGKELIDLNANIPNFPAISMEMMGDQKFRPAFGPIPWRMLQEPNSVKILFIGQDGTHIAEAAGRPATAGFGGRAQDLAKYFGVSSSAAFINTYAFTIKGQYGTFNAPIVNNGKIQFSSFVDNNLWAMSQDQDSPITQWRNELIEWIIRNNRESLKLIVLFGGGARDAAGSFVESRGGTVGTRFSEDDLANIQVPEQVVTPTFANYEVSVPVDASGRDLYAAALGRKVDYKDQDGGDVKAAQQAMTQDSAKIIKSMVFSKGGVNGSGILHPAQLGGYDIDDKMEINGKQTISLKGLKLSDGTAVKRDILVTQLPHPTALSMMTPAKASDAVAAGLKNFEPYVNKGWKIEADEGFVNAFAAGKSYKYARADMGPEYYDFGAPASRMVNVSTAARAGANVIIFGTRDKGGFTDAKTQAVLKEMQASKPSKLPDSAQMFTARPRTKDTRYVFDAGPSEAYAKLMKENLPEDLINEFPDNRDYGHYRGTFENPKVVIMADPDGYDDLITSRALTGTRGQFIHGMMEDLGIGDQYLVIKTAPFGKDDKKSWEQIVSQTETYREKLLKKVLKDSAPLMILTDGETAEAEVERILGARSQSIPVIAIERTAGKPFAGIQPAATAIGQQVSKLASKAKALKPRMADIPRSHLSYYARIWEGTSGDRVISSPSPAVRGHAFAEVAPAWATSQKLPLSRTEQSAVKKLQKKIESEGLRKGGESVPAFVKRLKPRAALQVFTPTALAA